MGKKSQGEDRTGVFSSTEQLVRPEFATETQNIDCWQTPVGVGWKEGSSASSSAVPLAPHVDESDMV